MRYLRHDALAARCGCHYNFTPADPSLGPRPFRLPGDPERFGRPRPFNIEHLRLDVALDITARRVTAVATLTITQRDPEARTLVLDAVGFEIASVTRGATDVALPHRYDGDRVHVTLGPLALGERAEVRIAYTVEPKRGLYFIRPDEHHPKRPFQVWSQCQDEDAKYWIPCHDFPNMRMSTEFVVTAPDGWTVISNGRLVSRTKGEGTETWHWHQEQPHVAYLMTLVAGRFAELTADTAALPVRYYVDPGSEADGQRAFGRTPEMIERFGTLTGVRYPWAKYYQVTVHDFIFGGMENTSATTMTDRILLDERAALDSTADDIVAHELAHQWFGDLVTCRDWSHAWLNEGFATFFEHLDCEAKVGRDEYLYNLKQHADSYFHEDDARYRRPVVCNTYAYPIDLFDRHLYEKGGWVLHMLRAELGDKLFFGGVKRYLEKHRGGIVETRDLLRAMEDESGRTLEGFFDQWLYRAGYPELEVEAAHDADKHALTVTVRQRQSVDAVTPLFRFKLGVVVVTAEGEERHTLEVVEASQAFALRVKGTPTRVAIDPEGTTLMRLSQKLPRDWLLDALANDARAIVRWRAAAAVSRRDERKVLDALATAVREDAYWGVGVEAARALGEFRSDAAFDRLVALLDVEHPKVRRAVVRALGEFRTERAAKLLVERIERGDPSWLVEGELARSAGRTRQAAIVLEPLIAALGRDSWRDVVRVGAIDGLATLRDERAHGPIDKLAEPGHMLSTRRAAVSALGEFGETKKREVRERLEQLLDANDPYFTPEVVRSLVKLRDTAAIGAIERVAARSLDGRVRRHSREGLRELRGQEHPDEVRRLSDALDRLRDEHQTLRDEIARVRTLVEPGEAEAVATNAKPARRAGKRRATVRAPAAKPRSKKRARR